MTLLFHMLLALGTMVLMEPLVALAHRHIMHGWGWGWHRDHHMPHDRVLEHNDWYALVGTAIAILLFTLAGGWNHWLWWVGLGMTVYGACYAFLHDGLVHKRWPMRWRPAHAYLQRLIEAHHLHHAVREKEGGVSFGFLYAPRLDRLRAELRTQRTGRTRPTDGATHGMSDSLSGSSLNGGSVSDA